MIFLQSQINDLLLEWIW